MQGGNGYNGLGTSYGSIIGSPPNGRDASSERGRPPPSLKLPGAALDPENVSPHVGPAAASLQKHKTVKLPSPSNGNAFEVGMTRTPHKKHASLPARYRSIFSPKRMNSMPGDGSFVDPHPRPFIKRVMSMGNQTPEPSPGDVPLEAYRELDFRQAEFFQFLDQELEKIEHFYKEKEDEATHRLAILRDQLHIMRDRRLDELIKRQTVKLKHKATKKRPAPGIQVDGQAYSSNDESAQDYTLKGHQMSNSWLNPIDAALDAVSAGKYGSSTKAMTALATPSALKPMVNLDDRRDFARRPELPDVPYQSAKRKLKVALQEYYRGLELLKSYALLNRTAFRKINKKYDKVVHARPSMRYMNDKVNKAWFVNSDVIEGHIRSVEDLYARYFERGNHKVAVGKLRVKMARAGDYTDNTFRNGLLLSAGASLSIQGLIKAVSIVDTYHPDDPTLAVNTSYLLQVGVKAIYNLTRANFGRSTLDSSSLISLSCCSLLPAVCGTTPKSTLSSSSNMIPVTSWTGGNLPRHVSPISIGKLLANIVQLPCWYFLFLGLTMQLNFHRVGGDALYLYWPVILIGLSTIVLFNPIRVFYYRSRMWLLYSLVCTAKIS
jgi:hypothetical protein